MASDGLRTLHPRQSLRRLKTALKPSSSPASTSPVRSESASSNLSPLSASPSGSSRLSSGGYSFRNLSAVSLTTTGWTPSGRRAIRRKKSSVEMEQEEEQREIAGSLTGLVEPRPSAGPTLGGIEEVLDGRV
ncbi:hypothetical protein KC332_g8884 [Hortaea werneckii]|uniref:Uncharacterized protein n=2 Tax=Hortaea werneckii TaxID=91943 RepID=A0A3M7IGG8_HORWE|nr:hypothetical protein KC358_g8266 [Hortaea werneckii]OTA35923.1 hypothetical protein BTJ68_04137 [Hortaea werneckii EXF-2000]KAI6828788.1 hypothetical protein KC350_g7994 [Hortaea werneckii]KAI6926339.1 hypothetical protein KC348_g8715 [Hortaea werneckii]KAI6938507.1 hypothetical protein KC341_g4856 [Hortaea werneckii]